MIFYFSGTGNSRAAAERIGEALHEPILSIGTALRENQFAYAVKPDETIGFVVPTYFWGLPTAVLDFLAKLTVQGARGAYTYAVLTCASVTGAAGDMLAEMLRAKGQVLSAQFGIESVGNYVPAYDIVPPEQIGKRISRAEAETQSIIEHIRNRAEGDLNPHHGGLIVPLAPAAYELYRRGRRTAKFSVDPSLCIGCGRCAEICPCRAIELKDGKPCWQKPQCTLCLGCLHRCPQNAISYGNSAGRRQYTNPVVSW